MESHTRLLPKSNVDVGSNEKQWSATICNRTSYHNFHGVVLSQILDHLFHHVAVPPLVNYRPTSDRSQTDHCVNAQLSKVALSVTYKNKDQNSIFGEILFAYKASCAALQSTDLLWFGFYWCTRILNRWILTLSTWVYVRSHWNIVSKNLLFFATHLCSIPY